VADSLQIALSVALWPVRRYEPERRALATLYFELARVATLPVEATSAPLATREIAQAHEALSGLPRICLSARCGTVLCYRKPSASA